MNVTKILYCVLGGASNEISMPPSHAWESSASRAFASNVHIPGTFLRVSASVKKTPTNKEFEAFAAVNAWPFYLGVFVCVCARWERRFTKALFACSARWMLCNGEKKKTQFDGVIQVILALQSSNVLRFLAFLKSVCEWVSELNACLWCYDVREKQNGDGKENKKMCYRVYKVYILYAYL